MLCGCSTGGIGTFEADVDIFCIICRFTVKCVFVIFGIWFSWVNSVLNLVVSWSSNITSLGRNFSYGFNTFRCLNSFNHVCPPLHGDAFSDWANLIINVEQ